MLVPRQYLGAFKCGHREKAKEFVDEEFSRELLARITASNGKDLKAIEALSYLSKFNNEFHKCLIKKGDPAALHNTDKLRRDVYSKQNSRTRDVLSYKNRQIPLDTLCESTELAHSTYQDYFANLIDHLDEI